MSKVGTKRQVRQLSVHEKLEAIQRVHEGESKASVARVMGVPESTLRGWCKNEDKLHAMAIKTIDSPETTTSTDGGPSESKRLKEDYQYHWNQTLMTTPLAAATTTLTTSTTPLQQQTTPIQHHHQQQQQQQQQQTTTNNTTTTTNTSTESWFWRWYKHYGFHNPLEPLPLVKSKSTLDTVLLNLNNNNVQEEIKENAISSDEDDPPETAQEALKHGEKFLRWLECCSDPSVTAVQLLQFRYLLNNVRSCAERRANKIKTVPRSRRK